METSQDLFKDLEIAEKLFSDGSIKNAQKKVRNAYNKSKHLKKLPNKLRHKLNAAINKSRYYDEISSFATNPKRDQLITKIKDLISNPLENPKKHAHEINDIQGQWQLLDISSKAASKSQWVEFNELSNKAWEPCKEYFDEIKEIKVKNAKEREKIIDQINQYVISNQKKWPPVKDLITYLRNMFQNWQRFAPVLDKDINKLKTKYYDARKPINEYISKQENINKEKKEVLINKVNEIEDDDNERCISKYNELKNEWQKIGPAGRKNDTKLWDKFNKSADRFFVQKKQVIENEIQIINNLRSELKSASKTVNQILNELKALKNTKNTKEFKDINKEIKTHNENILINQKKEKIASYGNVYTALMKKSELETVPNIFKSDIEESFKNKKSDIKELTNACIKLEIQANVDSDKDDQELRKVIQLELLKDKFNKKNKKSSNELNAIVSHFINNFSLKDAGGEQEKLWARMNKCFEVLI